MTDQGRRRWGRIVLVLLILAALGVAVGVSDYYNLLPKRSYTAEEFGLQRIYSPVDYNGNGVDDYSDFLAGAKADAAIKPAYDGRYWAGGYPPENIGVCTDVIWRAFRQAGYSLRDMVDVSIQMNPEWYPHITSRDRNIDFRRVINLRIFFDHYGISLTVDPNVIEEWQPGDIVVFGKDDHIGIISDKRNKKGWSYVLHNGGQPNREEDVLDSMNISGHYRFDAGQVREILLAFQ